MLTIAKDIPMVELKFHLELVGEGRGGVDLGSKEVTRFMFKRPHEVMKPPCVCSNRGLQFYFNTVILQFRFATQIQFYPEKKFYSRKS